MALNQLIKYHQQELLFFISLFVNRVRPVPRPSSRQPCCAAVWSQFVLVLGSGSGSDADSHMMNQRRSYQDCEGKGNAH